MRDPITRGGVLIRREAKSSENGGLSSTSKRHLFSILVLLELLLSFVQIYDRLC